MAGLENFAAFGTLKSIPNTFTGWPELAGPIPSKKEAETNVPITLPTNLKEFELMDHKMSFQEFACRDDTMDSNLWPLPSENSYPSLSF